MDQTPAVEWLSKPSGWNQLYLLQVSMFKRLFSTQGQIQKVFQQCKIDKSHDMPHTKPLVDLAQRYFLLQEHRQNIHINISIQNTNSNNINININPHGAKAKAKPTKRDDFLAYFFKKIRQDHIVQRMKALVLGHALLKKIEDAAFFECFEAELEKYITCEGNPQQDKGQERKQQGKERKQQGKERKQEECIEIKVESTKEDFLQENIISFYCCYLKKLIINFQTYQFAKRYQALPLQQQKSNIIQVINHGFVVLNLVNYILRSQYTFNKMGRYYLQHKELLAVFIKYLQDLLVYNSFVKAVTSLSLKNIKDAGLEDTKHHFLFVTEAQKTSDRLYQFFYNRYYYNQIKTMVLMPTFLSIHNEEYKQLVSQVKRRDKELVLLVRNSKYEQPRSQSCHSKTTYTEQSQLSMRTQAHDPEFSMGFTQNGHKLERREARSHSQCKKK